MALDSSDVSALVSRMGIVHRAPVVGGRWLDEDEVNAMTKITERGEW